MRNLIKNNLTFFDRILLLVYIYIDKNNFWRIKNKILSK